MNILSTFNFSDSATTIVLLVLVISIGLIVGKIKIKSFSIGISGVLFAGIAVSACGFSFNQEVLHVIKDFGLILFIFSVGLQVGPSFFSSFKNGGLRLNVLAIAIVILGVVVTVAISYICNIPMDIMAGVYSGAISSTPGLFAAQQTAANLGKSTMDMMANGYAITYPIGVIGPIITCILIRQLCKIRLDAEYGEIKTNTDEKSSGNTTISQTSKSNLLVIFGGITMGVILGSVSIPVGTNIPIQLGMAGGPLIVAILLGHFGTRRGWVTIEFINGAGMTTLREIGIALFLACVGLCAGGDFISTLMTGGYMWIVYGLLITMIPVMLIGFFARRHLKLNYYTIIGLTGGATTNTPVLAFANNEAGGRQCEQSSLGYASVYPLTLFLRIITAQCMAFAVI